MYTQSVSPINRMPAAMGEEQEGNASDNDLLFPDSENEVDRASAVNIECKANPSINNGEEGKQEKVHNFFFYCTQNQFLAGQLSIRRLRQ